MRRVIAIDGPAGSGKSTTARAVAEVLGFAHLDSGALYRAVTLAALERDAVADAGAVVQAARGAAVTLARSGDVFVPRLGARDVSAEIRGAEVTGLVSRVAAMPEVRDLVNAALRTAADGHPRGIVTEGRDIGTVVFPDAALKVYLVADPLERARRRSTELGIVDPAGVEKLALEIAARDKADSERAVAPLRAADGSITLDTTGMGFAEQVDRVVALARAVFPDVDPGNTPS